MAPPAPLLLSGISTLPISARCPASKLLPTSNLRSPPHINFHSRRCTYCNYITVLPGPCIQLIRPPPTCPRCNHIFTVKSIRTNEDYRMFMKCWSCGNSLSLSLFWWASEVPRLRERCGRCKNPWDGTEVLWWGHYPGGKGGVKTMVMVADIDDVLRGWRWENRRIVEEEREKGWELVECDWCGLKWKGGVEFGKHRKTCGGLFARIAANFA